MLRCLPSNSSADSKGQGQSHVDCEKFENRATPNHAVRRRLRRPFSSKVQMIAKPFPQISLRLYGTRRRVRSCFSFPLVSSIRRQIRRFILLPCFRSSGTGSSGRTFIDFAQQSHPTTAASFRRRSFSCPSLCCTLHGTHQFAFQTSAHSLRHLFVSRKFCSVRSVRRNGRTVPPIRRAASILVGMGLGSGS